MRALKQLTAGLILLVFLVPGLAQAEESPTRPHHVIWTEDLPWSRVLDTARENADQPILIDFYAQWCGPCKLMDAFVYNEPAVVDELADVFTFKVDIDKPEYLELKTRFNITLLPTLIWCDGKGREIDRFTGAVSAEEFLEIIRAFRDGGNTFNRIIDLVAANPEDPGLLFDLARRHAERGNEEQARVLYRRLMNLRFQADRQVVIDGMLGLSSLELAMGNRERGVDIARQASGVFQGEEEAQEVEAGLMAVAAFQGALPDTAGMLATYRLLIEQDDTRVAALDAYARVATAAGQDLDQASRYAIRAVVLGDNDPRMMSTLATCYFKRQQYRKAVRWMEKACAAAPDNPYYAERLAAFTAVLKTKPYLYRGRRR